MTVGGSENPPSRASGSARPPGGRAQVGGGAVGGARVPGGPESAPGGYGSGQGGQGGHGQGGYGSAQGGHGSGQGGYGSGQGGHGSGQGGYNDGQGGYDDGQRGYGAGQGGYGAGQGGSGRASVGGGQPGRASVGPATPGRASVGGSAAVGGAPVGRAVPGRAGVRPVSPDGPNGPNGHGGPNGPDGESGPRRAKHGTGPLDPDLAKRRRRRKIANWSIAAFSVVVMAAGIGIVGITYAFEDIPDINTFEPETTSVVFADGSELTTLGDQNRTVVPREKISEVVKHAVVAAEDNKFYDHHGIDMKGIARAAWNNVTGGDTQGASTITQQYARHAAELTGINYNRKIREALLSRKIEDTYEKDEILSFYLNAIYFGRGAHGIEAAANAFFNKSVTTPPGDPNAITPSEAAVLAAVIKQPEPIEGGHKGYDPQYNPEASKERWGYTLNNMVTLGWLSAEDRAKAEFPTNVVKYDPEACRLQCIGDKPLGHVMKYVRAELKAMGIDDWQEKPYKVQVSINPTMQKLAEQAASRTSATSPMSKLAENHQAALVAIDPSNGQVLAYYGGDNGSGFDYAGLNGGHPPGSTFKMYTLAAGLREGMSMDSYWDATKVEDKTRNREISDAGRAVPSCKQYCSLEFMTIESRNTAFYWMTDAMGADKVVEAARDAGVRSMWTNDGDEINLADVEPTAVAPSKFDVEVGFGQYPVKVIEHVNGLATLAARGTYNKAHFVVSVEKKNGATGDWSKVNGEKLDPKKTFEADQIDSMLKVLQKIPSHSEVNPHDLAGGRTSFAKSGTWELGKGDDPTANGDAWYLGATPQLAAGVWVGGKGDREALKEATGGDMFGGGTPGQIWEDFMNAVNKELAMKLETFPEAGKVGDPAVLANGVSPSPKASPSASPTPSPTPNSNPGPGTELSPTPTRSTGGGGNPGGGTTNTPSTPPTTAPTSRPPGGPGGPGDD